MTVTEHTNSHYKHSGWSQNRGYNGYIIIIIIIIRIAQYYRRNRCAG